MNFAVIGAHRDFFRKKRWIEFEGLLSEAQLKSLSDEIRLVLSLRLKKHVLEIPKSSPEELLKAGRDFWREKNSLKKNILNKNLAETASELIEKKPLRFGYDQLITVSLDHSNAHTMSPFLGHELTLNDLSCIQGVVCGLMLCLDPIESNSEEQETSLFSSTAGNGIYFAPDLPIPFDFLNGHSSGTYLMIVYTDAKAVYRYEINDPHTHNFKQLGYNFGDKLTEVLNPLVYS